MLSVNYIYNFLQNKQQKIDIEYYKNIKSFERINQIDKIENETELNMSSNDVQRNSQSEQYTEQHTEQRSVPVNYIESKFHNSLHDSFNILFNKSILDFYYDSKVYKNKSYIFTLFNAIFTINNEYFNLCDPSNKEDIIKEFIKNIDNDLFGKDLYQKFDYGKIRSFNKGDIQEVIKMSYQFKHNDNFSLLKRYVSDYLGVNLYIISVENDLINYSKTEYYLPNHFGNEINKFLPSIIIILENEIHKPVLNKNVINSHLLLYSEYENIIDNIWLQLKIVKELKIEKIEIIGAKYDFTYLIKLKIDNIKQLCIENNISIQKKSDITMKLINKLKNELIADLLKI